MAGNQKQHELPEVGTRDLRLNLPHQPTVRLICVDHGISGTVIERSTEKNIVVPVDPLTAKAVSRIGTRGPHLVEGSPGLFFPETLVPEELAHGSEPLEPWEMTKIFNHVFRQNGRLLGKDAYNEIIKMEIAQAQERWSRAFVLQNQGKAAVISNRMGHVSVSASTRKAGPEGVLKAEHIGFLVRPRSLIMAARIYHRAKSENNVTAVSGMGHGMLISGFLSHPQAAASYGRILLRAIEKRQNLPERFGDIFPADILAMLHNRLEWAVDTFSSAKQVPEPV